MAQMYENTEKRPTCLLVTIDTGEFDAQISIDELEELAFAAGADTVAKIIQKRPKMETATCIGEGKLNEAGEFCKNEEVDMVIFDCELTASQMRNIGKVTETQVLDRTMLILDIFAQRALSKEGKLQVELAQYQYRLPRLSGIGTDLSRQGGGIGTRGPGETKLETDKRHIRERIVAVKKQLVEMQERRDRTRKRREKDGVTTVAIVGYTNAGKSTLLNALTDAGVLAKNMLFATLDPTARTLSLPDGRNVMMIDTVGLVRRLPHHLVEAFKSTLEVAADADLVLNVCDITDPEVEDKKSVTLDLLTQIGAGDVPVVTVYSKSDLTDGICMRNDDKTVCISSLTGDGLEQLLLKITRNLAPTHKRAYILVPYEKAGVLNEIRKNGKVYSEDYVETGIKADVLIDLKISGLIKNMLIH